MEYIYACKWEARGEKQRNGRAYLSKATEGRRYRQIGFVDIGELGTACASAYTCWGEGESCCE